MQKIQSTDKKFHDGDGKTTMGTVVSAKFLNDIQNELCHVIETAGIDLDAADDTQLMQAFTAVLRKTLTQGDYASKTDLATKLDKTAKAADSDKLDGHDSDYYATTAAVTQAQSSADGKVSKSGDVMTGNLQFNSNSSFATTDSWNTTNYLHFGLPVRRGYAEIGFHEKVNRFDSFYIKTHWNSN